MLAVPAGGVLFVQVKALQNKADFVQAEPLYVNVLQVARVPAYDVHYVAGSTHPAPLVTQPDKKLLQSALVVIVFAAWEHTFTTQAVVAVAAPLG